MNRAHGGPDAMGIPAWDFSTNANACGPCPAALAAVRAADACRYPDPAYAALREALAAFHAVTPARVVLAASASEFIGRFTAWAAREGGRTVWLPAHAYGDYAHAAQAWGLAPVRDPSDAHLAWLCEPSSPLGIDEPEAAGLLLASQAWVVLDRAYEPLRLGGCGSFDAAALDGVWQLWTPNKALGLTGVRGAYAIAPAHAVPQARALDGLAPSWPLGAHAVAMLQAWVGAPTQDWLAHSRTRLREWKAAQWAMLQSLGWTCRPSNTNFFCARPPRPLDLQALRGHRIKLRAAASFHLPGEARLAVMAPEAQAALARAWAALGASGG